VTSRWKPWEGFQPFPRFGNAGQSPAAPSRTPFSRRLAWATDENELARAEAARRAAGQPLIDLTLSNPTAAELPYPAEALAQAFADPAIAQYHPAPRGLAQARAEVAADYARRGAAVAADQIVLTASSSESYSLLFKLLCNPGQAVLVPEPSYPLFDYLTSLEGLVPRPYRLAFDGRWHVDFASLDFQDAAAIVVVSPNNPTGSYLGATDCDRIADLAARHGIAIIADEVFADFPLAPAPDAVTVVSGRELPALTFSLGGLSKASGLPQMKLGWIAATGPADLVAQALRNLDLVADSYLSVGTPVQLALPKLLQIGGVLRKAILERVVRNLGTLTARIGRDSPCTLLPVEAGWSAIIRVPEVMSDEDWALRLLREHGVLVQPGYFFDLRLGATLVVSLLAAPRDFDRGIDVLLAATSRV
jgi:alanine-synthesizing transaminase